MKSATKSFKEAEHQLALRLLDNESMFKDSDRFSPEYRTRIAGSMVHNLGRVGYATKYDHWLSEEELEVINSVCADLYIRRQEDKCMYECGEASEVAGGSCIFCAGSTDCTS
jgi:hypothetical protein